MLLICVLAVTEFGVLFANLQILSLACRAGAEAASESALPNAGPVPADVLAAIDQQLLSSGIQRCRVRVEHNTTVTVAFLIPSLGSVGTLTGTMIRVDDHTSILTFDNAPLSNGSLTTSATPRSGLDNALARRQGVNDGVERRAGTHRTFRQGIVGQVVAAQFDRPALGGQQFGRDVRFVLRQSVRDRREPRLQRLVLALRRQGLRPI